VKFTCDVALLLGSFIDEKAKAARRKELEASQVKRNIANCIAL